jgi:hypothetical protein
MKRRGDGRGAGIQIDQLDGTPVAVPARSA